MPMAALLWWAEDAEPGERRVRGLRRCRPGGVDDTLRWRRRVRWHATGSKSSVQSQAAKILAAKTGQKLPKVTCTSGVAAKVGAVTHCTVVPHGMTLTYPVTITVRSIHGRTANFYVQVGQALGQANQAKICLDKAPIDEALTAATTAADFLSALHTKEPTLLELRSTAPSRIVDSAGTIVAAARQALQSGSITVFNSHAVAKALWRSASSAGRARRRLAHHEQDSLVERITERVTRGPRPPPWGRPPRDRSSRPRTNRNRTRAGAAR